MKLYSRKEHRHVERQIHFGIGQSTKTACGLHLFSRHVIVSIPSADDGAIITDDLSRVTCKRCLATKDTRLRKLIAIENTAPGIFDRDTLCGEKWLLEHGLDVSKSTIDSQRIEFNVGGREFVLSDSIKVKDRKYILRNAMRDVE